MTGLTKFVSKDMDVLIDAIKKYSVGMDDTSNRLQAFGLNTQGTSYPTYNIIKESAKEGKIERALACRTTEEVVVSHESKQHW